MQIKFLFSHFVLFGSRPFCGLLDKQENDKTQECEDCIEHNGGDERHAVEQRVVQVGRVEIDRVGEPDSRRALSPFEGEEVEVLEGGLTGGQAARDLDHDELLGGHGVTGTPHLAHRPQLVLQEGVGHPPGGAGVTEP